ncbi:hypothetical protein JAAARDRAFT_398193 [Jaapia argillacea MUCL 33604]|uniref:Uncharacterized protein n=1 Tax=Jaapia argillacea MUCL 33604 TaxID=933084 RepID=A0A067PL46_9AGAM|nr:hypothetical protein JAAARDRAFT_398193 [Jaapia argillacea MUCL 33604]
MMLRLTNGHGNDIDKNTKTSSQPIDSTSTSSPLFPTKRTQRDSFSMSSLASSTSSPHTSSTLSTSSHSSPKSSSTLPTLSLKSFTSTLESRISPLKTCTSVFKLETSVACFRICASLAWSKLWRARMVRCWVVDWVRRWVRMWRVLGSGIEERSLLVCCWSVWDGMGRGMASVDICLDVGPTFCMPWLLKHCARAGRVINCGGSRPRTIRSRKLYACSPLCQSVSRCRNKSVLTGVLWRRATPRGNEYVN